MVSIVLESLERIAEHEAVPIVFQITSRLSVEHLVRGEVVEVAEPERTKDYDALEPVSELIASVRPTTWEILAAYDNGRRVGGLVIARDTPNLDILSGRSDLAVILDIRVDPNLRGHGIGTALVERAVAWACDHGCEELLVETQDVNVAACRFYAACGFKLAHVNLHAYPGLAEVQLIWTRPTSSVEEPPAAG